MKGSFLCIIHYLTLVLMELLVPWLFDLVSVVLLVRTWRHGGHVGGQEQKHFSPLGTKLYFHVNSWRKNSIVLTPNMAPLSRGCKPRMKQLGKFLFPPGRDTSQSQGSPPAPLPAQYVFIRCQNTNHCVTAPLIYYLNKCTLENLRICISKPWLLKCQSIMTEKMFRIVSVLNESIEMMLKCLRNRGVISFLPPPGGPMADTSNWSTSFRIDVSFLEVKRAMRYKAITFGYDGATRRGTGSSCRGANALRVQSKGTLFWLKNLRAKVCVRPMRLRAFWEALMHLHHHTICVDPCLPRLLIWRNCIF